MKSKSLNASTMRIILSAVLLLLFGAGAGVFTLGYKQLQSHAASAQEVAVKAEASRSSLEDLVAVKKFLADNSDAVDRADQLVAQSKLYSYQDQIINDINAYANQSGIEIANISFDETKVTTANPVTPAAAAPSSTKSMTASVTIKNPTNYMAMLNFINRIEQSLFRMQISRISISQSSDETKAGDITSDAFTIEVYVR